MDKKEFIARRVAQEMHDGNVVNLGIGLPTLVSNYITSNINVVFQAENGVLGVCGIPESGQEDKDIFNAGAAYVTIKPGATFFDSATSFGYIRGGHVDVTVLGALQVDAEGNLANWMVPGKKVPGMGGAMDLVVGAKKVIVAMEHTAKGQPKIFTKCTFPLTAVKVVDLIVTEMGVMKVTGTGLLLTEIAEGYEVSDLQAVTAATLLISDELKTMQVEA